MTVSLQILLSVCGLYFHSFSNAFHIAKALVFNELFYIYFSFVGKNLSKNIFIFPSNFIDLYFLLASMVCFESFFHMIFEI